MTCFNQRGAACVIVRFDCVRQDGDRLWECGEENRAGEAPQPTEGGFPSHDPQLLHATCRCFAAGGRESCLNIFVISIS